MKRLTQMSRSSSMPSSATSRRFREKSLTAKRKASASIRCLP
nr:hypothetical protein P5660_02085 [Bacillus velezensis]